MKIRKLSPKVYALYTASLLLLLLLDQLTKWLAVRFLMPIDTLPLLEDVLHLTYMENRGAAFGMLADARWVFITLSLAMIAVLLPYLYLGLSESRLQTVGILLILGGGIGNMIDRLALGYVVDFIDVRLIDFAIFNGADSFVCVGAALLVLSLLIELVREIKKERAQRTSKDADGR